jgi:uncharacterized repeat protein (TIGR03803 family)
MFHRQVAFVALLAVAAFPAALGAAGSDTVLHAFGGPPDGSFLSGGALVFDRAGNLYGTTFYGGAGPCTWRGYVFGCGTVFELSPAPGGGWSEHVLYSFKDAADGMAPYGTVTLAGGRIYGVTTAGGNHGCIRHIMKGCGTAFELTPHAGGAWTKRTIHVFSGGTDGGYPESNLVADAAGNLYGTAYCGGGAYSCYGEGYGTGVFYELSRAGGGWSETVLHDFGVRKGDGAYPLGNVTAAGDGTIYGTTAGSAYEMLRNPQSGRWSERTLVALGTVFADGWYPQGGLAIDRAGNLYGMTYDGGDSKCKQSEGCGVVFELSQSGGTWSETVLHAFSGKADGALPYAGLAIDAAGRLYGTTSNGGDLTCNNGGGCGVAFELAPSGSAWTETVLHTFEDDVRDGGFPASGLIRDGVGKLYGTTQAGASGALGSVFEIAPGARGYSSI